MQTLTRREALYTVAAAMFAAAGPSAQDGLPFNYDASVARLAALGAKIERPELPGAPSFSDPDGMLVQVVSV